MALHKTISQEAQNELIIRAQAGCRDSMNELYEIHRGLIAFFAQKYFHLRNDYEFDDIYQIGAIGLTKAIKNFDISKGLKFATYAGPMIWGQITNQMRDVSITITSRPKFHRPIHEAHVRAKPLLAEGKTLQEVFEILNLDYGIRLGLQAYYSATASLNAELNATDEGDSNTLEEMIPVQEDDYDIIMLDLNDMLSDREKTLFNLRIMDELEQRKVAEILGVTQVQVSRLEKKLKEKIRQYLIGVGYTIGEAETTTQQVEKAKKLILDTNISFQQIAASTGLSEGHVIKVATILDDSGYAFPQRHRSNKGKGKNNYKKDIKLTS